MVTTFLVAKNRVFSKLAAAVNDSTTTFTVTAGEGANFPSTYPFHLTVEDEIVSVTNRSTDTLTVVRSQQSTSAAAHPNKAYIALNITAKSVTDLNTAVNFIEKYADYGLAFFGAVTTYTDTTHFKVSSLAGLGASTFLPASGTPYEIFVFKADGAAPQGEQTPVVAYTTGDGTFEHAAFTSPLAEDDEVLIIHPLLASLGTKAATAATGAVSPAKYLMAYTKQLVTLLLNATYGLSAIKTYLTGTVVGNATYGLSALKTYLVDTVYGNIASILVDYLAHGTWGLAAIRSALQLVQTKTDDIYGGVSSILTDYVAHGTWGLAAIKAQLGLVKTDTFNIHNNVLSVLSDYLSQMRSNFVRWGQISAVGSSTQFTSTQLKGMGVDAMHGWYVYVMQADDAAPEGEYRLITDYTDAGVISHNAFSTGLAVGDRVQLIHPVLYHAFAATRGSGPRSLETLGEEQDAGLDVARGTSGAVSVDGGEDNVYNESNANEFVLLELRVDLNNMAEGDTIVFKVYTTEGGTERKVSEDVANTFEGAQDPARTEIIGSSNQVWGREGIRVCAVKTAGTTRTVTAYYRDAKRGS